MKKNNLQTFCSKNYTYLAGVYKKTAVIWISFPYDTSLIAHLKENTKARWSQTNKKWYSPHLLRYRERLNLLIP